MHALVRLFWSLFTNQFSRSQLWGISNQLNLVSPDLIQCLVFLLLCSVCGKIVFQPKSGVTFSGLVYFNTRNYFNTKMHTLQIIASAWELRFYVSRPRINCSISGKVTFLNVSSGIALREHSCSYCPCFALANVPIRQTVSVFLSLSLSLLLTSFYLVLSKCECLEVFYFNVSCCTFLYVDMVFIQHFRFY